MKREDKILLVAFIAVLICVLGVGLPFILREPTAKIEVKFAEFNNDGVLTVVYTNVVPSGMKLDYIVTVDGAEPIEMGVGGGNSLLGFGIPSSGKAKVSLHTYEFPQPVPSPMVQTGRSYVIKLSEPLELYDFTNKLGKHYRAEFRLKPHP